MFTLDERLGADTFEVGTLTLSRLLLMNNKEFPWLILVPERSGMSELIDLPLSDRIVLMAEITLVSHALKEVVECDKLNVGALGNQVSQLHVHVIARFKEDKAWPEPVWGKISTPYTPADAKNFANKIRKHLSNHEEFTPILHKE
ncbi:MAG: hypothetical protein K0R63_1075 [Rickettsiales bacterium]|jgi:diadenosine tetraphosphate (Ap4A) HIT family hydrolase|nr:hypothetical protein [Rickettsiales bacterium]